MPATIDEPQGQGLRDRLLYARFRLLDSDEWADAEADAYRYLADRGIDGRGREKLLGLVTVALVWDRLDDDFERFVDRVVRQDRTAAADSADARVVEALRDLVFEELAATPVLGGVEPGTDADPFGAVEIPMGDVADRFEAMTGTEKSPAWVGHVRSRLGLEKQRKRDGTVISDPELGTKLRELCEDFELGWEPLEAHSPVERLPEEEQRRDGCGECGERALLTFRHVEDRHRMCGRCADEWRSATT